MKRLKVRQRRWDLISSHYTSIFCLACALVVLSLPCWHAGAQAPANHGKMEWPFAPRDVGVPQNLARIIIVDPTEGNPFAPEGTLGPGPPRVELHVEALAPTSSTAMLAADGGVAPQGGAGDGPFSGGRSTLESGSRCLSALKATSRAYWETLCPAMHIHFDESIRAAAPDRTPRLRRPTGADLAKDGAPLGTSMTAASAAEHAAAAAIGRPAMAEETSRAESARLQRRLSRDGYGLVSLDLADDGWPLNCSLAGSLCGGGDGAGAAAMGSCIDAIRREGWPASFIYMFDEPWVAVTRAVRAIQEVIGPSVVLLPETVFGEARETNRASHARNSLWAPRRARPWRRYHSGDPPAGEEYPQTLKLFVPLTPESIDSGCLYVSARDGDPAFWPPGSTARPAEGGSRFALSNDTVPQFQSIRAVRTAVGDVVVLDGEALHWRGYPAAHDTPQPMTLSIEAARTRAAAALRDRPRSGTALLSVGQLPDFASRASVIAHSLLYHGGGSGVDALREFPEPGSAACGGRASDDELLQLLRDIARSSSG